MSKTVGPGRLHFPRVTAAPAGEWSRRFTVLTWVGLALWLLAQALPAWDSSSTCFNYGDAQPIGDYPCAVTRAGLAVTTGRVSWASSLDAPAVPGDLHGLAVDVAWSVNVWLLLAVLARGTSSRDPAVVFSILATLCTVVALFVLAGAVSDLMRTLRIVSFGIGSYVWLASIAVTVIGVIGWAGSAPPPSDSAVNRPLVDDERVEAAFDHVTDSLGHDR